ncbi:serine hydrolase domain-containing protein [Ruicaihuangia caeni]|uniref:Serine hydrolase domain-containing protein n=1 Tax=Ruicaihuangia caeni TaxID=3042517 RepID=A0AAW6T9W8_9MICO|nr:serine hydrolase domain-containing protein [Klugiella sp. YN-L-19]MDI2098875.1 serine hydrolase domain-containing protein [Klugiella sp. YN-L-19]
MSSDPFAPAREFDFDFAIVVADAAEPVYTTGDLEAVYPWASCTKPLTAMAALVAVDEGRVSLDAPAGPEGATVRHLLAHAAGYAFDSDTMIGQPGRRRGYSNFGFDVLGRYVADAVGMTFADWLSRSVLQPLGMRSVVLRGSPAAGAAGTVTDLARLGQELIAPTLISNDLHREATNVVFPGLTGVLPGFGRQEHNDWGLGFEIKDRKVPHWTGSKNSQATFGHFGQSGSFLWVDPQREATAAFLGARPFSSRHRDIWPHLSDAILDNLPW